jgi:uracil-DNA glycosylase family 4
MRAVLQAISDELLRLKAEGETTVPVTEETLIGLRALVKARAAAAGPAARSATRSADAEPQALKETPAAYVPKAAGAAVSRTTSALPVKPLPVAAPVPAEVLPPSPTVNLPEGDKATRWAALKEIATTHPVCLAHVRPGKKAVLGVGSLDAKIMFVGEAPGAEEEIAGEPFVGPAGQLLTKMIAAMGLKREQVYIGNILCWRPQIPTPPGAEQIGNRAPTPEEMAFCLPFLRASIDIVKPDMIVALGGTAAQGLLGAKFTTLGAVRSQWHEFGGTPLMVTYHPSYLLRSNSNRSKRAVWEDLLQVMERAALPISDKQRGYFK